MNTGGFPGRRVATRVRAAAASPFDLTEPYPMRTGPSCLWRGVCPRDIATIAIAALDCALRRPRRRQPTTLPLAALWMAAPYHAVTKASRADRQVFPYLTDFKGISCLSALVDPTSRHQ